MACENCSTPLQISYCNSALEMVCDWIQLPTSVSFCLFFLRHRGYQRISLALQMLSCLIRAPVFITNNTAQTYLRPSCAAWIVSHQSSSAWITINLTCSCLRGPLQWRAFCPSFKCLFIDVLWLEAWGARRTGQACKSRIDESYDANVMPNEYAHMDVCSLR